MKAHCDQTVERLLVADGPVVWEREVVELELPTELRPQWLPTHRLSLFVACVRGKPEGETLCQFRRGRETRPALTRTRGGIVFQFDPMETIEALTHERYWRPRRPLHSYSPFHYSQLVPPRLRPRIRRLSRWLLWPSGVSAFPSWPIEYSVEALRALLEKLVGAEGPWQAPLWPNNAKCAVVLTHDLDSPFGQKHAIDLVNIAESFGWKTTCFVVGGLYGLDFDQLDELAAHGHEIALHGVRHDCRFAFLSADGMRRRLDACSGLIERYDIVGFRSPWLMRTDEMFRVLAERFEYDSSTSDTSRGSPRRKGNGCCTVFPFVREGIRELPITVPMDATLIYMGLSPSDMLDTWKRKVEWIRQVGGLAVLCTHPEPHFSARREMMLVYERFLTWLSEQPDVWCATAREVCAAASANRSEQT